MDEADYDLLRKIISKLNEKRKEPWIDIHNMRVIKYGSVIHIDCHLTVPWYFNVKEAHKQVSDVDAVVKAEMENNVELFIHTDACVPPLQCSICIMSNCDVRQAAFNYQIQWDLETSLQDKKHGIE